MATKQNIYRLEPADDSSIGDRLRRIQPYELLIFIILAILMALCLVVAETVIDTDAGPESTPSQNAIS